MISARASADALGHAAGKMVRIGVGERFEADQAHEFVHFVAFLVKHAARDQAGLDVAPHGEPRKKIRVLENQSALGAGRGDRLGADPELAGVGRVEAGDQPEQRGFSAAARTDEGHQFSGGDGERHVIQRMRARGGIVRRREMFAHFHDAERGAFGERQFAGRLPLDDSLSARRARGRAP